MQLQAGGIEVKAAVVAPLDPGFLPAALFRRKYGEMVAAKGGTPLRIALERGDGSISAFRATVLPPAAGHLEATLLYAERTVKFLLWQRGGWKVYVGGPAEIGRHIQSVYRGNGARGFDAKFMSELYERRFEAEVMRAEDVPEAKETSLPLGRHLDGRRVGFDLGASDRKASAVINGQSVFEEEVGWDPRSAKDPEYHYRGVMDSIRRAAAHLPQLDAVGGSAAGIYVNNRVRAGSLYRGVPRELFAEKIVPLFLRIGEELGAPLEVVNDGEVGALAGSMSLGENPVLGLAMGSSQAAGYVNAEGKMTGWLNELAFAPVDYRAEGPRDDWSGDCCGAQYFSQQAADRLARAAGVQFPIGLDLPERLASLQKKAGEGDRRAEEVFETMGVYLGYSIAHYADFYELKHVLLLGRVTSSPGGEIMLKKARHVLRAEFPEIARRVSLALPEEKNRRVGQAVAAASLPERRREQSK